MKTFRCACGQLLFFESVSCLSCGAKLGFLPDEMRIAELQGPMQGRWKAEAKLYRECLNYSQRGVCNWMIPPGDSHDYCVACRLNEVIPDLNLPANLRRWATVEAAKRRLVYTLLQLGLPVVPKSADPFGLSFRFLADWRIDPTKPSSVMTGHSYGTITINLAEADDAERELIRTNLHEPFRTLLGHFRHEIGHYFWDRLIVSSGGLQAFRSVFGDERVDYAQALRSHYWNGPPAQWNAHYVSPYASSHPWEDWAETWAHYLHMYDTVQTARDMGLGGQVFTMARGKADDESFEPMLNEWFDVVVAINSLNRSLGLADAYPFVFPPAVVDKLRFVYRTVRLANLK